MATAKIIIQKNRYIVVRVIENRVSKYISLGLECDSQNWTGSRIDLKGSRDEKTAIKAANEILTEKEALINRHFNELEKYGKSFDFDDFKRVITGKTSKVNLIHYIDRIIENKTIGNANMYEALKTKLIDFRGERMMISQVNGSFLNKFNQYLLDYKKLNGKPLAPNSISAYLRTFRAVINGAIKDKLIKKEDYPFENFQIKSASTKKRAMAKGGMEKIKNYQSESEAKMNAKRIFLFLYYCRGLNISDFLSLKKSDIHDNRIFYVREKLKKQGKELNIGVKPEMQELINQFNSQTEFIYPFLTEDMSEKERKTKIKTLTKRVNKYLKQISDELEMNLKITTYVSRHTYATTLKRAGVNTAFISDALGHNNQKTTQIYLDSIENTELDDLERGIL